MDIPDEAVAKHIIMDPAGKPGPAAKRDNSDCGVCRRPAGDFARIIDGSIERRRLVSIDKVHHALANAVTGEEIIVTAGKNIDNGIADGKNINLR